MNAVRAVVAGVGNVLSGDDGIGVQVVRALGESCELPPDVAVIDAGTLGMRVLGLLPHCELLLLVDAVDGTGEEPGTVFRLDPIEMLQTSPTRSAADFGPADVLQAASAAGLDFEAACIGVQVKEVRAMTPSLTPEVEASIPAAVSAVLEVLSEHLGPKAMRAAS